MHHQWNTAEILMLISAALLAAERDDQPVNYGIVAKIGTFNPLRIAFHEWAAIARELSAARSLREAVGVVFGPPGWRADGRGSTAKNLRAALRGSG